MKGLIFNIRRYSVHDGPGIRVTVFMKGCPLSCWWCHNPEGILPEQETVMQTNRVGDREFSEKVIAGKYYTVDDILRILERERIFMERSGGGVTFSGGEPFMQPDFLLSALKACKKEGIHTAVDTSGHFSAEILKPVLPYTDMFLFDLKHPLDEKHLQYTGVGTNLIYQNLKTIAGSSSELILRIPVVPGVNDDDESLERFTGIIKLYCGDKVSRLNLLPYHRTGASKYVRFNREDRMKGTKPPGPEKMKYISDFFISAGLKVKIGG